MMSPTYQIEEPWPWHVGQDASAIVALIAASFAHMAARIDPPSSAVGLEATAVAAQARCGEVWAIGRVEAPSGCVFLTPRPDALYLGKLAVAEGARRMGLARRLVTLAATRARALGLPALELQTRVELVENHGAFRAMGFTETARTAHPGFARPTSITFRQRL